MILNDNSTQQINTLVIQLQNRITNLNNESRKLNNKIDDLNSEISDLERRVNSNENDADNNIDDLNSEINNLERRVSSNEKYAAAMNTAILANTEAISGKADKIHTHTKSEITDFPTSLKNPNALTINGKTYDGSTAVDAGVQTVANGGTGVTTQAEINKAFIGNLEVGESDVTDGTEFVSSYASDNGFDDTAEGSLNKPYKRKFIKVWNYIKGKISSVLGLTKDNYGGKSAKSSFLDEYVGAGGTRPTSGNIVPKDASEYGGMRKDVVTSSMTDSGRPGQDGHLLTMFWDNSGRYDSQFFVSNKKQPLTVKVRAKANDADYGPWVDIITSQNIGSQTVAKASTAGTADYARNMYYQNLDLSELDKTKFYPLVCISYKNFSEVAICSESGMGSMDYNQNRIHFDISTQGWTDLPPTLNIREYTCYENNEITIGCIGRGLRNGAWAIWLRGGLHYTCFSRDAELSLKTSDYTFGDEVYTVGTNYYGGANSNVNIMFTPQSTIAEGAYSSRPITAPNITSLEQRVAALESKA